MKPDTPTLATWPRRYVGELYKGKDRQGERVLVQSLVFYVSPQNSERAERVLKGIAYMGRCDYIKLYPTNPCEKPDFRELASYLAVKSELELPHEPAPAGRRIILPK